MEFSIQKKLFCNTNGILTLFSHFKHPNEMWKTGHTLFIFTLSRLILSAFHTKYRTSTPSHHCMHGATGACLRPIPEIFGNFNFVEVLIFYNRKNLLLVLIFLKTFSRVISLVHLIVVAPSFKMNVLFDFNRCWFGQYIHILLLRLRWLRVSLVLAWS